MDAGFTDVFDMFILLNVRRQGLWERNISSGYHLGRRPVFKLEAGTPKVGLGGERVLQDPNFFLFSLNPEDPRQVRGCSLETVGAGQRGLPTVGHKEQKSPSDFFAHSYDFMFPFVFPCLSSILLQSSSLVSAIPLRRTVAPSLGLMPTSPVWYQLFAEVGISPRQT